MKRKYKNLIKFFGVTVIFLLSLSLKSYAGEFDNAKEYYNAHGNGVVFTNGNLYFGSAGATSSSGTRYRTLGWQLDVAHNGGYVKTKFKLGANGLDNISTVNDGTTTYSLYRVSYKTLMNRVGAGTGNLNNTNAASWIVLNAIMIVVENGSMQGDINEWGDTAWGTVYYDKAGIANARGWADPESFNSYFNKIKQVDGWDKPFFISVDGSVSDSRYTTNDGKVAWFTSEDLIRADVVPNSQGSDIMHAYLMIKDDWGNYFTNRVYGKLDSSWATDYNYQGFNSYNMWVNGENSTSRRLRRWIYQFKIPSSAGERNYSVYTHAINDAQVWANDNADAPIDTGYDIRIDNTAPKLNNAYITNKTIDGFDIVVDKPYDYERSGTRNVDFYFYYEGQWNVEGQYYKVSYPIKDNETKTYHLNYADIPNGKNAYGNFTVDVRVYDNLGNGGAVLKSLGASRAKPTAQTDQIEISNHEYESGGVYWVKTGDPFTAKVTGRTANFSNGYYIDTEYALVRPWGAVSWSPMNAFASYVDTARVTNQKFSNFGLETSTFSASKLRYSTGSYAVWTGGSEVDSYYNLISDNNLGDYEISPMARIWTPSGDYWDSTWGINRAHVRSDGIAPTVDKVYATNITPLGFDVTIKNVNDNGGSGVKYLNTKTYYKSDGKGAAKSQDTTITDGKDLFFHVNVADYNYKSGIYTIDVTAYDNVGNGGTVLYSLDVDVPSAKPDNGRLTVYEYDYKEPQKEVYWVKPNTVFGIYTDGSFPTKYNMYPDRTYLLFAKDGNLSIGSSARQYADLNGKYTYGSEFNYYFNFLNGYKSDSDNGKGIRFQDSGNSYLGYRHHLTAKQDNTAFKLYYADTYFLNGTEHGEYTDSNKWLKIDGKAPVASNISVEKQVVSELNLQISNLIDSGSGLNLSKFYMDVQPIDYSGSLVGIKESSYNYSSLGNNNYSLKINWDNCVNKDWYGKFKVQVYTEDNVGNKACIYDKVLDRQPLAIKGVIFPNPSRQGTNTNITIRTEGSANSIKVAFPDEVISKAVDEQLIIEKSIKVEPIHNENLNMRIPLETPITLDATNNRVKTPYKIYIEATNGYGDKVSGYMDLDVQGNVLDDIKVRLRTSGYDG